MGRGRWKSGRLGACAAVLACLCARAAAADDTDAEPSAFGFDLRASAFFGNVTGYIQTPLGGNPGTTSPQRPTLHELGISDEPFWEVTGRLRWGQFVAFGGYSGLELDSSGTLSQSLVSHGVFFPAGSPFTTTNHLDVANFGGGWNFDFDDHRLTLFPKIDVALLDFSYSLDSPGARAARAYTVTAVRLGAEGSVQLGRGFALEFDGVTSLPIPHMPQLANVTGRLAYHLFPSSPVRSTLFLGTGMRWIYYEDSQTVPNHIHVRTGALLTGGFSISF
ncbi:MAG: hypothetical protein ACHQ6T_07735 [Myxococcota bacterium]